MCTTTGGARDQEPWPTSTAQTAHSPKPPSHHLHAALIGHAERLHGTVQQAMHHPNSPLKRSHSVAQ